jgi:hypothetical protein
MRAHIVPWLTVVNNATINQRSNQGYAQAARPVWRLRSLPAGAPRLIARPWPLGRFGFKHVPG